MKPSTLPQPGTRPGFSSKVLILFTLLVFVLLTSLVCWPSGAYPAEVKLAWDPNADPDLAGYKVYYGDSSRNYGSSVVAGNRTDTAVGELQEGRTYYFAATAYDIYGNESDYSEEVSYEVPRSNSAPIAQDGSIETTAAAAAAGRLIATDGEGDKLTYSIVQSGSKGSVTVTDMSTGSYTYAPNADQNGTDTFTFKANDGALDSNIATVTVTITPVNHAPVAVDDEASTSEATPVTINVLANDSDADGDNLSVTAAGQPANGSVAMNGTSISYQPRSGYSGIDVFTYTIGDGNGATALAKVSVRVVAANHPPVASSSTLTVLKSTAASGTLKAGDADGDPLTYTIIRQPKLATLKLTDTTTGSYIYQPSRFATGTDSFAFRVNDGKADSNVGTVWVTVRSHVRVWLEAEHGSLNPPMKVAEDSMASGGEYAFIPGVTDGAEVGQDLEGGYGEYTFEAPVAAYYFLFARASSDGSGEKVFQASVDSGEFLSWNTALGPKDTWVWSKLTEGSTSVQSSFYLEAGVHTLVIKQKDDGSKIDKMLFTTQPAFLREVLYEGGEDGTIGGWDVPDADPPGAQIANVYDEDRQGNVIELTGSKTLNRFRLLSDHFTRWGNTKDFVVEWNMKYSEPYVVLLEVRTTAGKRFLSYLPSNDDLPGSEQFVRFGVGDSTKDGRWHRIVRNLQNDIEKAQPGVKITSVDSFSIRGSGRVDDITLRPSL